MWSLLQHDESQLSQFCRLIELVGQCQHLHSKILTHLLGAHPCHVEVAGLATEQRLDSDLGEATLELVVNIEQQAAQ